MYIYNIIYIYTYIDCTTYIYVPYIYICTGAGTVAEGNRPTQQAIYIYIYMYICVCIYIYIHIGTGAEAEGNHPTQEATWRSRGGGGGRSFRIDFL